MKKFNIMLIICDQLRQDALGCYGNPVIRTPNIDHLANESLVFSNAFCTSPICVPARISIMTGRYMSSFASMGHVNAPHIGNILRSAGYETAALGKMHFVPSSASYGFEILKHSEDTGEGRQYKDDYQRYLSERGLLEWNHGIDNWDIAWAVSTLNRKDYVTTWNGDQAVEYITAERSKHKPFFCVCSFPKPHPPFDPPKPYDTMYDLDDMPLPKGCEELMTNRSRVIQEWDKSWNFSFCSERHRQSKIISHYYGNITLIDEQIGRIINALKEQKIYDDTVIVFLSDHGEQLGDQGCFMKHFGYNSSVKIPLMIKIPGNVPGKYNSFVNQTDILPTLCEIAGVPTSPLANGHNLIGLAAGKIIPREFIVSNAGVGGGWFSLQTKEWKYIYYFNGGDEELYDISNSHTESINLAKKHEYDSQKAIMREMLITWLVGQRRESDPGAPEYLEDNKLKYRPYDSHVFDDIKRRSLAHRIPEYLL